MDLFKYPKWTAVHAWYTYMLLQIAAHGQQLYFWRICHKIEHINTKWVRTYKYENGLLENAIKVVISCSLLIYWIRLN